MSKRIKSHPLKSYKLQNLRRKKKHTNRERKQLTGQPEKTTIPAVNKPPNCERKRYVKYKQRKEENPKSLQDEVSTFVTASNQRLEMAATLCHILRASPTHSIFHSKIEFRVKNAPMVLYISLYNRVKNRFTPNIE